MAIPDFQAIVLPLLRLASDGEPHSRTRASVVPAWTPGLSMLLLAALALTSGCAEHVVVFSKLVIVPPNSDAEITGTPALEAERGKIRGVGLVAPDYCDTSPVSALRGESISGADAKRADPQMLRVDCGALMAEFERMLTKLGFVVTSWRALSGGAAHGAAPLDQARQLGVQVLLQVNSLERIRADLAATESSWERTFERGGRGESGDASLDCADRTAIRALLAPKEEEVLASLVGMLLDVTAIHVPTGQTVWFYHRQIFSLPDERPTIGVRAQSYALGWSVERWLLVPGEQSTGQCAKRYATSESSKVRSDGNEAFTRFRLARALVADASKRLATAVAQQKAAP